MLTIGWFMMPGHARKKMERFVRLDFVKIPEMPVEITRIVIRQEWIRSCALQGTVHMVGLKPVLPV